MQKFFIGFVVLFVLSILIDNQDYKPVETEVPARVVDVRIGYWPDVTYFPPEYSAQQPFPGHRLKAADMTISLPCNVKGNQTLHLPVMWDVLGMPDIFHLSSGDEDPEWAQSYWRDLASISARPYQPDRRGFAGAGKSAGSVQVTYLCGTKVKRYHHELNWDYLGLFVEGKQKIATEEWDSWQAYLNRPSDYVE
jgi:hypothetical protein